MGLIWLTQNNFESKLNWEKLDSAFHSQQTTGRMFICCTPFVCSWIGMPFANSIIRLCKYGQQQILPGRRNSILWRDRKICDDSRPLIFAHRFAQKDLWFQIGVSPGFTGFHLYSLSIVHRWWVSCPQHERQCLRWFQTTNYDQLTIYLLEGKQTVSIITTINQLSSQ